MGSSVPKWPMDFSPLMRRSCPTTSWLVMPPGLSTTRSPFTLTTVADRAHASQATRSRLPYQRKDLRPRLFLAEASHHGAGHRRRILFLDSTHHHAQVAGFNHHAHALRRNRFLNRIGNLPRQPFLHLQAARKYFNQARNLAQPDDLPLGNIGHMHTPKKRQHVMLAQ